MNNFADRCAEYYDYLMQTLTSISSTLSLQDKEDLIQDTYVKALSNQEKFKEGTNLRAWLATIAVNTAMNQFRQQKYQREVLRSSTLVEQTRVISEYTYDAQGRMDRIEFAGLSETIQELLRELTPNGTDLLYQYHGEEMSYTEIVEAEGLPIGTVASTLYRSRKYVKRAEGPLKRIIEDFGIEDKDAEG